MFKKAASLLLAASLLATTAMPVFAEGLEADSSQTSVTEESVEPSTEDIPQEIQTEEPAEQENAEENPSEVNPQEPPAELAEESSTPETASPLAAEPETLPVEESEETPTDIPVDTVSRIDWIADLVSALDLSVDADQFPDDYYPDVAATDEHYQALMSAVAAGIVDLDAGENFRPDDATTREFAAQTLNSRLGFVMQSEEYTFNDSADTAYAADLQIAVEQEWFALEDGKVLPQQPATAAELAEMLEKAKAALAAETIDPNYQSHWTFASDVVVVPNGTKVEIDENNVVTIIDNPVAIAAGQRFAAFFSGVPVPFKAVTVTKDGRKTIIKTTTEGTDDAITDADSEGIIDIDPSNFTPAEATTYMVGDTRVIEEKTLYDISYDNSTKTLTASKNIEIGSATNGTVVLKLSNITLEHRVHTNDSALIVRADTSISGTLKLDALAAAGLEKTLDFGVISIAGIGKISIGLELSASGKITVEMKGKTEGGFVRDDSGFRTVSSFTKSSTTVSAQVDAQIGMYFKVSVGIPGLNAGLGMHMGLAMQCAYKHYDSGKPKACLNAVGWVYAKVSITAQVLMESWNKSLDFLTQSNSPFRVAYHYEDGVSVPACTRGGGTDGYTGSAKDYNGKYYTSSTSSNFAPVGDSYQDEFGQSTALLTYTIANGKVTITGCKKGIATLDIPDAIEGYPVTAIAEKAFFGQTDLVRVTISDNVRTIGDTAFYNCTNLRTVYLSTAITTLEGSTFYGCRALKEIFIPKSLTVIKGSSGVFATCDQLDTIYFEDGIEQIPEKLFYQCNGLKEIRIPSTVTTIGKNAFSYAKNLSSVTIPESVTTIENRAFAGCSNLAGITLPDSVKTLGDSVFSGCSNLKSAHLSNGITVLPISTFYNCDSLQEVYLPKALNDNSNYYGGHGPFSDTSLQTVHFAEGTERIIPYLFTYCASLQKITIPETVTSIGTSAFSNCSNLTSITVPDSVTKIEDRAFGYCTSLKSLSLPNKLQKLEYSTLVGCTALETVYIPKSLTKVAVSSNYGPFYYCSNLKNVEFEEGTTQIIDYLFAGCKGLEKIVIPETVTSIGVYAFYYNDNLQDVTVQDGVTNIGNYAFSRCANLNSIILPDSVTSLGDSVFSGCDNLESVHLSNNITVLPLSTFYNCTALQEVYLPKALKDNSNYYSGQGPFSDTSLQTVHFAEGTKRIIPYLFTYCASLQKITIPETVTSIGTSAFSNCSNLTSITVPDSVTKIEDRAFGYCTSLKSLHLPNKLQTLEYSTLVGCTELETVYIPKRLTKVVTSSSYGPFYYCSNLKNVEFEEGTTKIIDYLFAGCKGLEKIVIPATVKSIGAYAFYYNDNLHDVTVQNGVTSIGNYAFSRCANLDSIVLPDSITSLGESVFSSCNNLESVHLSNNITILPLSAFYNCSSLQEVYLPKDLKDNSNYYSGHGPFSDTSLQTVHFAEGTTRIIPYLFTSCESLQDIAIPDTVTNIGDYAFQNCTYLYTAEIPASVTTISPKAFSGAANVEIYGEADSYAEIYASENNIPFVEVVRPAAITAQPQNATVEDNAEAHFSVQATGSKLSYQWQLAYPGSNTWQNVPASFEGGKTNNLAVTATKGRDGYRFRCVVTDGSGNTVTSEPVRLTVKTNEPLKILSLTANKTTADSGDLITVTANVTGGAGGYTYKFIINDTTNDSWYKLQDYNAANSIAWKATSAGTKRIMVDVKDKAGNKVATNISIKVNGTVSVPLSAELKSSAVTVKQGETVTLTAVAKGGSGKYNYKFIINDKTDDKWYRLQDFGANNVITWKATTPGTKRLMVDVMDSTGKKVGHNITITVTK